MKGKTVFEKLKKPGKSLYILLFLLFVIVLVYSIYNNNREKFMGSLETIVYAPGHFISGTDASLRVIILARNSLSPIAGANVSILLKEEKTGREKPLFEGLTDLNGSPDIKFKVPEDVVGDCELIVNVRSNRGDDDVSIPIIIRKDFKLLLTSDKTVYRPGQTIHIRGLVFEKSNVASQQKVKLEVVEPKGTKVFAQELETCNYGIADVDFTLGHEVNTGTYAIRANIGEYCQERTVYVTGNAPPQFNIKCNTNKTWYVPGEMVRGSVKTAYFFGKPISRGEVKVTLFKHHNEKSEKITDLYGTTNSNGIYEFAYQLPPGKNMQINEKSSDLLYQLRMDISVQDRSDQLEKITRSIPVSANNILIQLVPESGKPKTGLENTIYIATTFPDGRPTASKLNIETWIDGNPKNIKNKKSIHTNQWGIGKLKINISPQQRDDLLRLVARDSFGNSGEKVWKCFTGENQEENIILRANKSIYRIGDTAGFTIFSTQKQGHVFVDFLKDSQIIGSKKLNLVNGKGHINLPIKEKMQGTLTCCARMTAKKPTGFLPVLWDMQKIIVQPKKGNKIDLVIRPDKKKYFPGQEATIHISTRRQGKACAAALGINIVDESNQAMNQTHVGPGTFYYQLDKRLLKPEVCQAGFSFPGLLEQRDENITLTPGEKQEISSVLLASQLPNFYRSAGFAGMSSMKQKLRTIALEKRNFQIFQVYLIMILLILVAVIFVYSIKKKEIHVFWAILLFILYMVTLYGVMDYFSGDSYAGKSGTIPLLPLISSLLLPLLFSVYGIGFLRSRNKRTVLFTCLLIAVCVLPLLLGIVYYKPFIGTGGESMKVSLLPKISLEEVDSREESEQPEKFKEHDQVLAREFSPEILYFNPRIITDGKGKASFKVKIANIESVSQWQVSALAHNLKGKMGPGNSPLPVTREIFANMELPTNLIQNDEISFPVSIHNYLPSPQTVALKLEKGNWFDMSGSANRTIRVKARDSAVEYFKIRARALGSHPMTLKSLGTASKTMNPGLSEEVMVIPAGKEIQKAFNYILKGNGEFRKHIPIPETAIKDSDQLLVRIYPGYFSQLVEGMESMLRMPHGCFEQTTSVLYPDVMVLEYLKETGRTTPEIEEKAGSFIASGYQNLLQYETTPGGFSFYGGIPQKIPTAFGLLLFSDMARVSSIDESLIPRIQQWLLSQMTDDHWEPDGHFGATSSERNNNFTGTAYVSWALLHSGLDKNNKKIKKAIAYLEKNYESYVDNPNALSYCALSLVKAKKGAGSVLQRLNKLARKDSQGVYWTPGPSAMGENIFSTGVTETTAIAALANLEANNRSLEISPVLYYLLKNKNAHGIWGSTQATVLTLKVLVKALPYSSGDVFGMVNIWMNNEHVKKILFTGEDNTGIQVVDLNKFIDIGNPELRVKFDGSGELFCQVLSSYYLRWDDPSIGYRQTPSPINLDLTCKEKQLKPGEILTVEAAASYTGDGVIHYAIIDLGIPPGFKVRTGDFNKIMAKGVIERFEISSGRILLYLNNLDKVERRFQYRLKAISPGRIRMPEARVYDYYDPEVIDAVQPFTLTVSE